MIFVTIGTQLPFPRLMEAMNSATKELGERTVAQIGPDNTSYPNLETVQYLAPEQFEDHFNAARVIVAHAGIGTILSAKAAQKPLILLPRRHSLGEHRNDHQLATARQVENLPGVHIAWQETEVSALLKKSALTAASSHAGPHASTLIKRLKMFIDT